MFLIIVIFSFLLILYFFGAYPQSDFELSILLYSVLVSLVIMFWYKERNPLHRRNYVSHSNLIILSFVVVFFQMPIEYLAKNVQIDNEFLIPRPNVLFKTVHVLSISFVAFLIGYLLKLKIKPIRNTEKKNKIIRSKNTIFLAIGSVLSFLFYVYITDKSYFSGNYAETKFTATMVYANVLYGSITTAYFTQKAVNLRMGKSSVSIYSFFLSINKGVFLTSMLYLALTLNSGDRGPFMFMGMIYFSAFLYASQIRLKLKIVIPSIVLSALILMFIGIVRAPRLQGLSIAEKIDFVIKVDSNTSYVSSSTIELAGSFRTANVAVAEIPQNYDYFYGDFIAKSFTSIIPGISRVLAYLFYSDEPEYLRTPASFITYLIQGSNPRYGDGTTAVSDIYLDFGLLGCIFIFLIFGWSIANMERRFLLYDNMGSISSLVIAICYLASAIGVGRDSIFGPFIIAVRVLIFIYLNNILVKGLKKG